MGLFNIGAAGQYVVGVGACLYFALRFNMPWYVCLIAAIVTAADEKPENDAQKRCDDRLKSAVSQNILLFTGIFMHVCLPPFFWHRRF